MRIPAIVATLGTLAVYRGGVIVLRRRPPDLGDGAAGQLRGRSPGSTSRACRSWSGWPSHRRCSAGGALTRTGRNLYALGSNPESARLVGINETGTSAFVFILSGLLCGLVGVLWGARFGTVDAVLAPDLHLQAISAVVIGGVSIFGGSGSVYGAAIGAVIFAVLQNGVQLLGINQFWLQAVIGAAILGTVMFYSLLARGAERPSEPGGRGKARLPIRPGERWPACVA